MLESSIFVTPPSNKDLVSKTASSDEGCKDLIWWPTIKQNDFTTSVARVRQRSRTWKHNLYGQKVKLPFGSSGRTKSWYSKTSRKNGQSREGFLFIYRWLTLCILSSSRIYLQFSLGLQFSTFHPFDLSHRGFTSGSEERGSTGKQKIYEYLSGWSNCKDV